MGKIVGLHPKLAVLVFCPWDCISEREGAVNVGR
jgi:hypothetical protein